MRRYSAYLGERRESEPCGHGCILVLKYYSRDSLCYSGNIMDIYGDSFQSAETFFEKSYRFEELSLSPAIILI